MGYVSSRQCRRISAQKKDWGAIQIVFHGRTPGPVNMDIDYKSPSLLKVFKDFNLCSMSSIKKTWNLCFLFTYVDAPVM